MEGGRAGPEGKDCADCEVWGYYGGAIEGVEREGVLLGGSGRGGGSGVLDGDFDGIFFTACCFDRGAGCDCGADYELSLEIDVQLIVAELVGGAGEGDCMGGSEGLGDGVD